MPRKPKPKNTLSAGERVALFEAEREKKQAMLSGASAEEASAAALAEPSEAYADNTRQVDAEKKQKVTRELPKPQCATVKVDFSLPVGEIRPIHGMCNGPVSYGADLTDAYREIGVPYVRFDCADTAVSAYAVDLSRIFRDSGADPSDAESYDFSYTDRYVEAAYRAGAEVIFRLGESVDFMGSGKRIAIPEDVDRLARVCINVIRHYNDGWANGFTLGIKRFELWSHDPALSARECLREFELYRSLTTALSFYSEEIKVGGMCFDGQDAVIREFVRYCQKNHVRLDFLTLSCFDSHPQELGQRLRHAVALVRNCGFDETELIVGRWCYTDSEVLGAIPLERLLGGGGEKFAEGRRRLFEEQSSVKGAAFVGASLIEMLSIPELETACFFDAQPMLSPWCAISDRFGRPQKPYYAFKAFGELYRARKQVLCQCRWQEGFAHPGVYACAAVSEKGEGYVMIASFGGCGVVDLRLDGIPDHVYSSDVYLLDGVKDLSHGDTVPISGMKKRMLLNVSEYGVVVVKIY